MYQQIVLIGNVGRDSETRFTASGVQVTDFSVAVNKRRKNANTGEYTDDTTWFKVSAWRGLAETCSEYVTKGMQVLIVGEVKVDAYIAKDGTARASLEVTAQEVKFLSRRDESQGVASGQDTDWIAADNSQDIPF